MTEGKLYVIYEEVKGDRDKERKVTYKLQKEKIGEVRGVFHLLFEIRGKLAPTVKMCTPIAKFTIKMQQSFTSFPQVFRCTNFSGLNPI